MLVKLAFVIQRFKKISKKFFVMINKDGGTTIFQFYGGDTAVMKGDIELMGESPQSPPLGKTLGYGVEDAKRMSNKLNNASWGYDNLEKIRDNLKSCDLAKNKSWCLLQQENSRERVRKPDVPLYDDQEFM